MTTQKNNSLFFCTIKETSNVNSDRKGYDVIEFNLSNVKRNASRNRSFLETTLKIENRNGELISYKEPGKKWVDIE